MTQPTTLKPLLVQGLRTHLGETILNALDDPNVVEVMANPDGSIWIDQIRGGRINTGATLAPKAADSILRLIADHAHQTVTHERPIVSAVLPGTGERFEGLYPPLVAQPSFAIRKKPEVVFDLDSYVARGALTEEGRAAIAEGVEQKKNMLVVGGTGSGKTTLVNAILALDAFKEDRVAIIEDTKELQCSARDRIDMLTRSKEPFVTMRHLVKSSLRLRPDRIIIGEVRDGAALELLKAWNTGHPGGIATLHANSAEDALARFEDLIAEAIDNVPYRSIVSAINRIVFVQRGQGAPVDDGKPQIMQIVDVKGRNPDGSYIFTPLLDRREAA